MPLDRQTVAFLNTNCESVVYLYPIGKAPSPNGPDCGLQDTPVHWVSICQKHASTQLLKNIKARAVEASCIHVLRHPINKADLASYTSEEVRYSRFNNKKEFMLIDL